MSIIIINNKYNNIKTTINNSNATTIAIKEQ